MLTLLKFNLLRIIMLMWFLSINCIEINHQNHGGGTACLRERKRMCGKVLETWVCFMIRVFWRMKHTCFKMTV